MYAPAAPRPDPILVLPYSNMERKKGLFGRATVRSLISAAPHPTDPDGSVTGCVDGHLLVWKGRNVVRIISAHQGAVNTLQTIQDVGMISGGADARVRVWFKGITPGLVFDLRNLASLNPAIRSVCWDTENTRLLVATAASEVFEVADSDGSDLHGGPLLVGHCKAETSAVAVHPSKEEFVTAGDDKTVRVWDLISRKPLRYTKLDCPARAVTYSPDGKKIGVGMGKPSPPGSFAHK